MTVKDLLEKTGLSTKTLAQVIDDDKLLELMSQFSQGEPIDEIDRSYVFACVFALVDFYLVHSNEGSEETMAEVEGRVHRLVGIDG